MTAQQFLCLYLLATEDRSIYARVRGIDSAGAVASSDNAEKDKHPEEGKALIPGAAENWTTL